MRRSQFFIYMRNFLLILNGVAIADFFTRGRAINAFRRRMLSISADDILELYNIESGVRIASNI